MLQVKLTWKLCFHPNKWRETPFKVHTEALRSSPSETVSAAQTLPHRFTVVFLNTGEEPLGRIKMDAEFNLQESQALSGTTSLLLPILWLGLLDYNSLLKGGLVLCLPLPVRL